MLAEQYQILSQDRKLLLLDVGANSVFKELLDIAIKDCVDEIVNFTIYDLTAEQTQASLIALKCRHQLLIEFQELMQTILNDHNQN